MRERIIAGIRDAGVVGAGGAAGTGDAANLLKPALARGTLRTIGATTFAEYKKYIEKDPALTRRFQSIQVEEPSEARALLMMRGVASTLETHHKVQILDEALDAAVRLSHRYIPARQLPDKAVSLLDTASARVAVSLHATPAEVDDCRKRIAALETEREIITREKDIGLDVAEREAAAAAALAGGGRQAQGLLHLLQQGLAVEGFGEEAEDAAAFYAGIFPNSRVVRVTAVQGTAGTRMVEFELFGQPFIAMSHPRTETFNHTVSLMVSCADQAELDRYWSALLDNGGTADGCGWLRDRFGVSWQIVPDALIPMMAELTRTRPTAAWIKLLEDKAVPCGPINHVGQAFDDEQVRARGLRIEQDRYPDGQLPAGDIPLAVLFLPPPGTPNPRTHSAIAAIRERCPASQLIFLGARPDIATIVALMRAGIDLTIPQEEGSSPASSLTCSAGRAISRRPLPRH